MKIDCEYVRKAYEVPAEIGLRVIWRDRPGTIYQDGGNYVSVNFDDEKPGYCSLIHPTDPDLKYLKEHSDLRVLKLTKSQKNYQRYLDSECDETFSEWMGFKL